MKIKKNSLLMVLLFFIIILSRVENVNAASHELESLDINVFINDDGSAIIKERRVGNFIEGTENYIVIENLGRSMIKEFKVTENGRTYEKIYAWNIDETRENKKFKNGIIKTIEGYELAWGIGDYGRHEYVLEYKVTDFIKQLSDTQVLFWRFVNDRTNIPPKKVTLSVESNKSFNVQKHKVWGFGFSGDVRFSEGRVIASSDKPLKKKNYVTVLVKLEPGMFKTNDYINDSFENVKKRAFKGSDYSDKQTPFSIVSLIPFLAVFVVSIIFVLNFIKEINRVKPGGFSRRFKEEYYREYPYEGNILDIYYILYKIGLGKYKNILTGFLLKWIKEERITILKEEVGVIKKKPSNNIKFLNKELPEEELEAQLFKMLLKGARGKDILKENSFRNWAKRNHRSIDKWEQRAVEVSAKKLESLGHIKIDKQKKTFTIKDNYTLTNSGKEIEDNIYKYVNYLHDFSLLNESDSINVKLWDQIMIWAGFLGITSVVETQFKKLYPKYIEQSAYRGNTLYLTRSITRNVSNGRIAGSSRSSGSGGSTSIGGGGGSFGGGSGGGTR